MDYDEGVLLELWIMSLAVWIWIVEYAGDDTSERKVMQDNIKEFESITALYISFVISCLKSLPFVYHPK